MKHLLLFSCLCSLFYSHSSYGQEQTQTTTNNATNESHAITRQVKLFFSVGTEYRTGPIENPIDNRSYFNRGIDVVDLNRGTAFNYSLDYFFTNNFSIGFSYSIRYDHIYQAMHNAIPGGPTSNAIIADQYGLIMDYHVNIKYHFHIAKEEFFFQAGLSFLNNAPKITKNSLTDLDNIYSDQYFDDRAINQKDMATKFGLGYQKNRFSIMGGIYFSDENPLYQGANYILPYFELKYQLGDLFKKKVD